MNREWLAVYGAVLSKAKYRRLSPSARGALLHCWALGTAQKPEASWPSRDALVELLELDGFSADDFDALVTGRWLEADDEGRVWIHDWDDHQLAATKEAGRQWEAARKQTWRRKKAAVETPSPTPPTPVTRHDMTLHNKGPGPVPDTSGTVRLGMTVDNGWERLTDPAWQSFREAWTAYGLKLPPTDRQREKLWPVVDAFPGKVALWIGAAPRHLDSYGLCQYLWNRYGAETGDVPPDDPTPAERDDRDAAAIANLRGLLTGSRPSGKPV